MRYLAAERLALLVLVAALAVAYLVAQRRRRQYAVRFTNLELLSSIAPRLPAWRRHLPAGALLAALAILVVAFARPVRDQRVVSKEATVVLAVDVSNSMSATDVPPNRLVAAQAAAVDFARGLPNGVKLGLISFDGTARVLVPPTADRKAVTEALDGLVIGPGTAAGEAVFAALGAIEGTLGSTAAPDLAAGRDGGRPRDPSEDSPARIVVMSDGKTTLGRDLPTAADAAVEAGVPVSTVAFGTSAGTVVIQGQVINVPPDEAALHDLAESTGGEAFTAETADELRRVYSDIGSRAGSSIETRELTSVFVGFALLFLLLAATGSLLWSNRLV